MPIDNIAPLGGMDLDNDPTRVNPADYREALDVTFTSDDGTATVSAQNKLGNKFSFQLGSVTPQAKVLSVKFFNDGAVRNVQTFRSNGLPWFSFSYTEGYLPPLSITNFTNAFNLAIGAATPSFTATVTPNSVGVLVSLGQVGMDWDMAVDGFFAQVAYEAVGKTGIFKPLESKFIDNDLFVWSAITEDEPLIANVVSTTAIGVQVKITVAAYPNPFIGLQHIFLSGSGSGMDGAWLALNSIGQPYVFVLIGSQWSVNSTGGTVQIGTEAIGELGVALYNDGLDTYTYIRLIRSRQFGWVMKHQIDARPTERNIRSTNFYFTEDYNPQSCLYYKGAYIQDGFITYFNPLGLYAYETLKYEKNNQQSSTAKIEFVSQSSGGAVKAGGRRYTGRFSSGGKNKTEIFLPSGLINTYSQPNNGLATGNIVGDDTGKINHLVISGFLQGVFDKVELIEVLYTSGVGAISARAINTYPLNATQTSIKVQHTGNETGSFDIDSSELLIVQQLYKTVKSNQVIDNRLVNSNVTYWERFDLREFFKTFKHTIIRKSISDSGNFYSETDKTNTSIQHTNPVTGLDTSTPFPSTGSIKYGEYSDPLIVSKDMSLMINEVYRHTAWCRRKDNGSYTEAFWIDDICINNRPLNENAIGLAITTNRRVGTQPATLDIVDDGNGAYSIGDFKIFTYGVEFSGFDLSYQIDGKPFFELFDEIHIGRPTCIPEILYTGIMSPLVVAAANYVNGNADPVSVGAIGGTVTDGAFLVGSLPNTDGSGVAIAQPSFAWSNIAQWNPTLAERINFYSPDHDMAGNNVDSVLPNDKIINFGSPFQVVSSSGLGYSQADGKTPWHLDTAIEMYSTRGATYSNLQIISNLTDGAYVNEGGVLTQPSYVYSKQIFFTQSAAPNAGTTLWNIASSWVFELNTYLDPIYFNVFFNNVYNTTINFTAPNTGRTDKVCYGQYWRRYVYSPLDPESNKYGKFDSTVSYYTGYSLKVSDYVQYASQPFPQGIFQVYGGDVFNQKYFHKIRIPVSTDQTGFVAADNWVGGGGACIYYSQNRHNARMVNKTNNNGEKQYPLLPFGAWLSKELANTPRYDPTYDFWTKIKAIAGYTTDTVDTDAPTRVAYSSFKPQDGTFDGYRDFQPLNFQDVPLTDGEITHHERLNGELYILQARNFLKAFFNTRGVLETSGNNTAILIGDGSVLGRPPIQISAFGSRNKWSFIRGRSAGGNDVAFILDLTLKAIIRFAGDGSRNISLENHINTFIRNNTAFLNGVDTPAWKYGVCGGWDENKKVAIWSARAINNQLPLWVNATSYTVGNIVWFGDLDINSGWEELPAFYECIQANTSSATNKPNSGADWQLYWKQLPLSDNRVYNVWTIEWDEVKNSFTTFNSFHNKIFMQFRNTYLTGDPRLNGEQWNIYEHNKGEYGVWYNRNNTGKIVNATLRMLYAKMPNFIKHWLALDVNTLTTPYRFDIKTKKNDTFMVAADMEFREDMYVVEIKNDTNDPTFIGQNDQDTSEIRGQYVEIMLTFVARIKQHLTEIVLKFNNSARTPNT